MLASGDIGLGRAGAIVPAGRCHSAGCSAPATAAGCSRPGTSTAQTNISAAISDARRRQPSRIQ